MKQHKDCNFSFAGLKTQVRHAIESRKMYAGDLAINFAIFFNGTFDLRNAGMICISILVHSHMFG